MSGTPALIERLNQKNCIDTRWISAEVGKQLKHVHEDVRRLFIEQVDSFDLERNREGKATCIWLPLAEALYLMSTYSGTRAEKARALIMQSINFYLFEAPRLRAENVDLKARLVPNTVNRLPAPKARVLITSSITRQTPMFGGEEKITRAFRNAPIQDLTQLEVLEAELVLLMHQQNGISQAIMRKQNQIDYRKQPPSIRLAKGNTK